MVHDGAASESFAKIVKLRYPDYFGESIFISNVSWRTIQSNRIACLALSMILTKILQQ